jgi:hypothetical protein
LSKRTIKAKTSHVNNKLNKTGKCTAVKKKRLKMVYSGGGFDNEIGVMYPLKNYTKFFKAIQKIRIG